MLPKPRQDKNRSRLPGRKQEFDRVWHDSPIFKITQQRIKRKLIKLIKTFLKKRECKIIVNQKMSD